MTRLMSGPAQTAGGSAPLHARESPWATNTALIVFGSLLVEFTGILMVEFHHFVIGRSMVSFCQAILYIASVWLILTRPVNRWTFGIILAFAAACRLVCLMPAPVLSTDIYRYVWDGMVQHAGINPYRYVPGDDHLKFLRDSAIFPHINRRDYARTIYPPGAQIIFYCVTWISHSVVGMKVAMGAFECLTVWALVRLMRELGIRRERVLLYAWNPLLIWEIGSSGHLDAAVMAFIALALLFRFRKQPVATGMALGMAIMVKFYPIVLLPALFRKREWRMPATVLAVVAAGYGIYASVGKLVFGYLGGYANEEGLQSGTRYFLLDLARSIPGGSNLSLGWFLLLSALIFAALLRWTWRRAEMTDWSFLAPAFSLAIALMLLYAPHYPWYVAWLIPFLTLMPNLPVLAYLMEFFYLFSTALAVPGPKMFLLNKWLYGTTLAISVACLFWQWPSYRRTMEERRRRTHPNDVHAIADELVREP